MSMKMTMVEFVGLEPCPFCGGDAHTLRIGSWWCVACRTPFCCDVGKFDTEAEAIKAWNTRADDQSQAAAYRQRMYEETVREEIVRCRDCRCKHDVDGRHLCTRWQFATEPDGFCAWGERKDANE